MNPNQKLIYEQVLRGLAEEWAHVEKLKRGLGQELVTLKELETLAQTGGAPQFRIMVARGAPLLRNPRPHRGRPRRPRSSRRG